MMPAVAAIHDLLCVPHGKSACRLDEFDDLIASKSKIPKESVAHLKKNQLFVLIVHT